MSRGTNRHPASVPKPGVSYNLRSGHLGDSQQVEDGQVGTTKMASSFKNRDDPDYIKFMEDDVLSSRQDREEQSKLLNMLVAKMDNLETKTSPTSVGWGILRTPLKDAIPAVGRGRGATGPVFNLAGQQPLGNHSFSTAMDPTPSYIVNGPLTSVLQQLSIAIDPTPQASVKGLFLRPEYYVQHIDKGVPVKNLDHSKMTFKELMSGMSRVMIYLSKSGGDLASYLDHFSFITRKAGVHSFLDSAYVSYDRTVVESVINGESDTFIKGDLFAVALHFNVGNLSQPKPMFNKTSRGRGFRRGGRGQQGFGDMDRDKERERDRDRDQPNQAPLLEGFPEDICYNFNYRTCHGKCSKSHICRLCRGPHKANSGQCPSTKK